MRSICLRRRTAKIDFWTPYARRAHARAYAGPARGSRRARVEGIGAAADLGAELQRPQQTPSPHISDNLLVSEELLAKTYYLFKHGGIRSFKHEEATSY